jgi:alpha-galactosidase
MSEIVLSGVPYARRPMVLADRPPMGWNSWNCFLDANYRARVGEVTADAILGCARALVGSGMREAGYDYVVLDDCWQAGRRDSAGRLAADPMRFPDGIAALADQIHALGLRFGLYTVPGSLTCAQQYDGYGGEPLGSLGYEELDAQTFAEWGVDFLKYDWCRADDNDGLYAVDAFSRMRQVLDGQGRPIVYAISEYGLFEPWQWAPGIAHMWRTTGDLIPTWDSLMRTLDLQAPLAAYSRPGAWNDPDMLQVGNGALTEGENRAHFYLWAVLNAPLMAGNDLRSMSQATRDLLCDSEVIAVNQDWGGRQGTRMGPPGPGEVWAKPMSDGGAAVVLLNRSDAELDVSVTAEELALARDISAVHEVGTRAVDTFDGRIQRRVEPHDATLLNLLPT